MQTVLTACRDAFRTIRRDKSYAAAVIATLALTLGAAAAVFSIVNGVLLRPLAYPDAHRLVSLREISVSIAERYSTLPANGRHFGEWRDGITVLESIALIDWRRSNLTGAGEPAEVPVVRASGTFLDVLQVTPMLGRTLTRADEDPERAPVAVVSHQLWETRLGRDSQVLGRTLTLDGTPHTIVGVLAPGTELPAFDVFGADASLTATFAAVVPFRTNLANIGWLGQHNYPVIGRLRPGATIEQARAEFDVLQQSVSRIAERETGLQAELRGWMGLLEESVVGRARLRLLLLLAAVGGVVLLACANLANLSLTRAIGRMRDTAVLSALGATRARLVGHIVLEQVLLAVIGGALGLAGAHAALRVFVKTAPVDLPRVSDVVIDWRVAAFAVAVALVAGLVVALLPAWRIGHGDTQAVLRNSSRSATDRGGLRVRSALLATQVALSVALLAVTGLFVASFVQLTQVDPGFVPDRVVAVGISPGGRQYPNAEARAALYDRIMVAMDDVPGVSSAAWASALPLTGETWVDVIGAAGDPRPSAEKPSANYRFVGPDYFETLSMPLVKGRSFEARERDRPVTPAVISARAAETLWPDEDPIGRVFTRGNPDARFEVVGVTGDGHPTTLEAESPLMVYLPYWYNNEGRSVLLVRTSASATAIAADLRRVIHGVDPEIAIAEVSPLQRVVDDALQSRRYQMWLFAAFGGMALLIATVGVYATTAYGVSRRRREMNIRVALGAQTSQVFALILRQSATPLGAGIAAGCAAALAAGTVVSSLLFRVRASDPLVLTAVVALVGIVGMVASAAAARRALNIDPSAALRDE